jgi:uncharacterized protein
LFRRLQPALGLSIDQYEDLLTAIAKGHGHRDWQQMQRLCQRLWLKTTDPIVVNKFDREFWIWQQQCQDLVAQLFPVEPSTPPAPEFKAGILPKIPPRNFQPQPEKLPPPDPSQIAKDGQELVAFTAQPGRPREHTTRIQELPIRPLDVRAFCRSITRRKQIGHRRRLDLPRTMRLVQKQGGLYNLVLKPTRYPAPALLILVDTNSILVPYQPVYQSFLEVIMQGRWPAQIYGFDRYPVKCLDNWETPWESTNLDVVWHQVQTQPTVLVIISDAGAASGIYRQERAAGTQAFLVQAHQRVQQLYWLNPLPPKDWKQTTAAEINKMLHGQMLPFDRQCWQGLPVSLAMPMPSMEEVI